MTSISKRKKSFCDASNNKKSKTSATHSAVRRDLLERSYASITTLREHVLSKLPGSSRLRRKKIASLGQGDQVGQVEANLAHLLDTSLVCCHAPRPGGSDDTTWEQFLSFSQRGDESYVSLSDGVAGSIYSQSEVDSEVSSKLACCSLTASRSSTFLYGFFSLATRVLVGGQNTCYVMASDEAMARVIRERQTFQVFLVSIPTHMFELFEKTPGLSYWLSLANPEKELWLE